MTLSNMSPSHPFAQKRGYERCKVTNSFRENNDLPQIYTLFNKRSRKLIAPCPLDPVACYQQDARTISEATLAFSRCAVFPFRDGVVN